MKLSKAQRTLLERLENGEIECRDMGKARNGSHHNYKHFQNNAPCAPVKYNVFYVLKQNGLAENVSTGDDRFDACIYRIINTPDQPSL